MAKSSLTSVEFVVSLPSAVASVELLESSNSVLFFAWDAVALLSVMAYYALGSASMVTSWIADKVAPIGSATTI